MAEASAPLEDASLMDRLNACCLESSGREDDDESDKKIQSLLDALPPPPQRQLQPSPPQQQPAKPSILSPEARAQESIAMLDMSETAPDPDCVFDDEDDAATEEELRRAAARPEKPALIIYSSSPMGPIDEEHALGWDVSVTGDPDEFYRRLKWSHKIERFRKIKEENKLKMTINWE